MRSEGRWNWCWTLIQRYCLGLTQNRNATVAGSAPISGPVDPDEVLHNCLLCMIEYMVDRPTFLAYLFGYDPGELDWDVGAICSYSDLWK